MRTIITRDPYLALDEGKDWSMRGIWPCRWISCRGVGEPPFVTAYRRRFGLGRAATVRTHVSADERYELYVDGVRVGRGPERGDRENWFYETYDLELSAGDHVIVARVWSLGDMAPYAQMSVRPGFIFATEDEFVETLGTGVAPWEARKLPGYEFDMAELTWGGTGANVIVDGAEFAWGFETGEGGGWEPVDVLHEGTNGLTRNEVPPIHMLKPATLPPMIEQQVSVGTVRFAQEVASADTHDLPVRATDDMSGALGLRGAITRGERVIVPERMRARAIIDLEDYYCAYPQLVTSAGRGSTVRILWAESLFAQPNGQGGKGNRDQIEGKFFWGVGDTFRPDGGSMRRFETLWWQAGRYLEVYVETAEEPLVIESLGLLETHYPMEMDSAFESSDARLAETLPIMLRGLQMCSHETYMDCPYYEQLMYVGDTRLEVLTTYAVTRDDSLPRKAVRMFDASRVNWGLTQSRYPSRVRQIIPPFSLWWVGMVYDYAMWRDDPALVRTMMPGVRGVVDYFHGCLNSEGLVHAPNGWNYTDWTGWPCGVPPDGEFGVSGIINWQFVLILSLVSQLEEMLGQTELAARARRLASELAARLTAAFWDEGRGLFADDLAKQHFSEHAQCLVILSGQLGADRQEKVAHSLLADPDLTRTTIYFSHYLFETYSAIGSIEALFDRLGLWFELEKQGFKTTFEEPEPSRSDCHAWGAHPIYHYFASILGIRPASPGFNTVRIQPQLGHLTSARGTLVHPKGEIDVDFRVTDGHVDWSVVLPEGVTGTLVIDGETTELA